MLGGKIDYHSQTITAVQSSRRSIQVGVSGWSSFLGYRPEEEGSKGNLITIAKVILAGLLCQVYSIIKLPGVEVEKLI